MPMYGTTPITAWYSSEDRDPHDRGTRWRYSAKWGLEWRDVRMPDWVTELSQFVSTPERVALWYRLMREVYPE